MAWRAGPRQPRGRIPGCRRALRLQVLRSAVSRPEVAVDRSAEAVVPGRAWPQLGQARLGGVRVGAPRSIHAPPQSPAGRLTAAAKLGSETASDRGNAPAKQSGRVLAAGGASSEAWRSGASRDRVSVDGLHGAVVHPRDARPGRQDAHPFKAGAARLHPAGNLSRWRRAQKKCGPEWARKGRSPEERTPISNSVRWSSRFRPGGPASRAAAHSRARAPGRRRWRRPSGRIHGLPWRLPRSWAACASG